MKRPRNCRSTGLGLADLLVVVVLIPLALVAFAGCYRSRRGHIANRVKCASNLRQIGQALFLYANENRGAYPRTRYAPGDVVIPTWGTGASAGTPFADDGPAPNDVTAALFLLLRTQEITAEVFACPESRQERWNFGGRTALNWSNWNGADGIGKHLSYAYQNPYPDNAAVAGKFEFNYAIGAEFAVAADIGPGIRNAKRNVLTVTTTSSAADFKFANSPNHDNDGQNVLYGDGHVEFQSNPFVGVQRDNIYARRKDPTGYASSEIRNSPRDAADSVLLPPSE